MISKIENKRKAEKAEIVFVHCGGDTYQLVKSGYGTGGDFYEGNFVKEVKDNYPNVYVEGGDVGCSSE